MSNPIECLNQKLEIFEYGFDMTIFFITTMSLS